MWIITPLLADTDISNKDQVLSIFIIVTILSYTAGFVKSLVGLKRKFTLVIIDASFSALLGLGFALAWYSFFPQYVLLLYGTCILAILSGAKSVDGMLIMTKKVIDLFVSIRIPKSDSTEDE